MKTELELTVKGTARANGTVGSTKADARGTRIDDKYMGSSIIEMENMKFARDQLRKASQTRDQATISHGQGEVGAGGSCFTGRKGWTG